MSTSSKVKKINAGTQAVRVIYGSALASTIAESFRLGQKVEARLKSFISKPTGIRKMHSIAKNSSSRELEKIMLKSA